MYLQQAKVAIGTRGRVNDTVPEQVRDGYIVTDLETENRIKALCRIMSKLPFGRVKFFHLLK